MILDTEPGASSTSWLPLHRSTFNFFSRHIFALRQLWYVTGPVWSNSRKQLGAGPQLEEPVLSDWIYYAFMSTFCCDGLTLGRFQRRGGQHSWHIPWTRQGTTIVFPSGLVSRSMDSPLCCTLELAEDYPFPASEPVVQSVLGKEVPRCSTNLKSHLSWPVYSVYVEVYTTYLGRCMLIENVTDLVAVVGLIRPIDNGRGWDGVRPGKSKPWN